MAVLPKQLKLRDRQPALKGVLMQDISNGQERSRIWPEKRGPAKSPAHKAQVEWFRQAQWATKYQDPKVMATAMKMTKGTPLLPRDIMTMMFAGRWMSFINEQGSIMVSRQAMQDVSESIDTLGNTVGSTLIRGPTWWEVIPPIPANRAGAQLERIAGQHINGGPGTTTIAWASAPLDQAFYWDAAHPEDIIIPAQGWYQISFHGDQYYGPVDTVESSLWLNGAEMTKMCAGSPPSGIGLYFSLQWTFYANTGDIVQCRMVDWAGGFTWINLKCSIVGNA